MKRKKKRKKTKPAIYSKILLNSKIMVLKYSPYTILKKVQDFNKCLTVYI